MDTSSKKTSGILTQTSTRLYALKTYAAAHKVLSGIAIVVILGGGWWVYARASAGSVPASYVLGTVTKGTIVASVSATGQVSASNSIDVKPKVSGEVTWVGVKPGDIVHAGQQLATIDDTDARRSFLDAQNSLKATELQYQKDSAQAPISYQQDLDTLATDKENLTNDYNDSYNLLTSTYLDLPAVMTAAEDTLYGFDFDTRKAQWNMDVLMNLFTTQDTSTAASFEVKAKGDYTAAKSSYDAAVTAYKQLTRASDSTTLEAMLNQTVTMTTSVAQALQTELNFLGAVSDLVQTYDLHLPSNFPTVQSTARSSLTTVNGDLSSLLAEQKTLTTAKQQITTAQQNISLDQVGNDTGANPISLQIEKNNLEKQTEDLAQQQADLANYTVRAPFDGTVSSVAAKQHDLAGSSVATVVTKQQVAQLNLNEVDVSKIELGDKATLTFDAIDGLTLTGSVVEIDAVGTVSQGVVSYVVKVGFDSQDLRVKPGMTANASIISAVHQDVLTVPSSAVKTRNGQSYVQVFNPPLSDATSTAGGPVTSAQTPTQIPVTVGVSDDTSTEILSGLTEGQQIVVRTVSGTAAPAAAPAAAAGGARGGFGGGGGALRIP